MVPFFLVLVGLVFEELFSVIDRVEKGYDDVLLFLSVVENSFVTYPVVLRSPATIRLQLLFGFLDRFSVMGVGEVVLQFIPEFAGELGAAG